MSFIQDRDQTVIFKRRVSDDLVRKANAIVTVCFLVICILMITLVSLENVGVIDGLYEVVSAVGTVGLSRALTPSLHTAGRILIIIGMYLGRIGPISMALFFNTGSKNGNSISVAEGKFIVG